MGQFLFIKLKMNGRRIYLLWFADDITVRRIAKGTEMYGGNAAQ